MGPAFCEAGSSTSTKPCRTLTSNPYGALALDPAHEADRIARFMREALVHPFRRAGFVVAVSGGVDSAVCAALAVRAVGAGHVRALLLPERESDPASRRLATQLVESLGIEHTTQDIAPALDAVGCYQARDEAIRRVVPAFGAGWRSKLVLTRADAADAINVTQLAVQPPDGAEFRVRLGPREYRAIVAATNYKQRVRKMVEYFHADVLHYAVVGTPNRLEYELGFFVKGGDGLADVKPIAHLYKTQVFQLADYLEVPEDIRRRTPTTDTFSLPQTQEEFYYALPLATLDRVLHANNAGLTVSAAAKQLGLAEGKVSMAYADIAMKRKAARALHRTGLTLEPTIARRPRSRDEADVGTLSRIGGGA